MKEKKSSTTRRGFLVGILAGAGALAAMAGKVKEAHASPKAGHKLPEPVLYRRTKETDRYYRTLYT